MLFNVFACLIPVLSLITAVSASPHPIFDKRSCKSCGTSWSGYKNVGYFTNWGIYDPQNYYVTNITAKDYTHINYAFANVDPDNGTVFLDDPEADYQTEYPGDNLDEEGNNIYGNLKQLFLLKEHNRNLKVLLSIGGASYSPNFANIVNSIWRETFVNTSVALLNNFGFDGLDIDYDNSPENEEQGKALTELLRCVREGLDKAARQNRADYYELTAAVGCGVAGWGSLDVYGMDQYLDFWNLMAYDFSGEWTELALPSANLWPDTNPANDVGASGSQCVQHYAGEGVGSRKLVLGMPLYGTAFNGSKGMWTKWTDLGDGDYDQAGNYDDKHLPLDGAVMFYNQTLGSSWSYDNRTGHVVSFDTPTVALQKAKYVLKNQLGGMMYWSIDQDFLKMQKEGKSNGRIWPGKWDKLKGECKKFNYGKWKGVPWPLPESFKSQKQHKQFSLLDITGVKERGYGGGGFSWNDWNKWGEWDDMREWKIKSDDGIYTNIGYSLVDTVVTAFEKYGGGLDKSKNNLNYPNSEYDNVRNGFRK
ncbi:uncharacterized protein IL334_005530 [Kwoniella shivajii]|uniref:GH18 domain-containing protein n=1 Tax=Kwoniella shivajii TaxID=564305 RepID=A0ABZ1D3Q5_9TREE|nr:hypothetical protein IL334_005530 [Kwoniella shivajii]